jgi:hypothetical protein
LHDFIQTEIHHVLPRIFAAQPISLLPQLLVAAQPISKVILSIVKTDEPLSHVM